MIKRGLLILAFVAFIYIGFQMSGGMRAGQDALDGKKYDEAISLWEDIAENGTGIPFFNPQTKAQQKIGHVHAFRDDGMMNMDEAIKWWRRAASGGNVVAQFALAQSFRQGDGVEQSNTNAYVWAVISAEKKTKSQRRYQVNADTYKKDLTSEELSEASKLITKCTDSDFKDCPY
tara:strand:+ start:1180 stop:1704 length:525 start_codon:yes stop_codon:yes gene_type:complete